MKAKGPLCKTLKDIGKKKTSLHRFFFHIMNENKMDVDHKDASFFFSHIRQERMGIISFYSEDLLWTGSKQSLEPSIIMSFFFLESDERRKEMIIIRLSYNTQNIISTNRTFCYETDEHLGFAQWLLDH